MPIDINALNRRKAGLTAADRTPEEKREIEQQMQPDNPPQKEEKIDWNSIHIDADKGDSPYPQQWSWEETAPAMKEAARKHDLFNQFLGEEAKRTGADKKNVITRFNDITGNDERNATIKDIASQVSPYYKKYRASDKLTLTDQDWEKLTKEYNARYKAYGEDFANEMLDSEIKDNVASNQSVLEKGWFAVRGMGADAIGSTITTAGMLYGAGKYIIGQGDKVEGLNGFQNFWNNVIDNDVTRFGNDVITYGTILNLENAKELGISDTEIMNTSEQAKQFLSWNTPFELLQQGGFTLASMWMGMGYAKAGQLLFNATGKGIQSTVKSAQIANKMLQANKRAENITNKFVIPGLVGTVEGGVEGLNTKMEVQKQGYEEVLSKQKEVVENEVQRLISEGIQSGNFERLINREGGPDIIIDKETGEQLTYDEIYKQVWDEYDGVFKQALDQVDYAASEAGITNFMINSAINGILASTAKAGLQAKPVQEALRKGKLTGWAFPKTDFKITGKTPGNVKVDVKGQNVLGKTWTYIKEPLGEFGEEYLQTLSDSFSTGIASHNIHSFIDNKYNGDAMAAVGADFSGDFAAGLTTLKGELVSKESLKSGVYGALSSVLGLPTIGKRTTKVDENGNVVYKRDKDGNIKVDKKGNPIVEKTLFGRGLNAEGKAESNWERMKRITPWRSGLIANISDARKEQQALKLQAESLEKWLNDPNHLEMFNGLIGTMSWNQKMEEAAAKGNEFDFRNSELGMSVSNIMALQKAEGSELYQSIIKQLTDIAYMEEGSKEAKEYVDSMRKNVNSEVENLSDEELVTKLKSNAQKQLDLMSKVKKESDKIDQLLGPIDEDVKQSLVFGQITNEDFKKREKQLKEEVNNTWGKVDHNETTEESGYTDEQKEAVAQYGSVENANKAIEENKEKLKKIKEDIVSIERRKKNKEKITNEEKIKLNQLKAREKELKEKIKKTKDLGEVQEGASGVLSAEEIMRLDPQTRALMIYNARRDLYDKLHNNKQEELPKSPYNEQQQAEINKLIENGTAEDRDFLSKIIDLGRIIGARQRFLTQYNGVLTDPKAMVRYTRAVKAKVAAGLTRENARALNDITDYKEFREAFNEGVSKLNPMQQAVFIDELKNNENYKKLKQQEGVLGELLDAGTEYSKTHTMSDGFAELMANALAYAYDNGVDLENPDEMVAALKETNEQGENKFVRFVNDSMANIGEQSPQELGQRNIIEQILGTYNEILNERNKNKKEQESRKREIPVTENTSSKHTEPNPTPQPKPEQKQNNENSNNGEQNGKVGIFGKAATNPDEGFSPEEKAGGTLQIEQQQQQSRSEIAKEFEANNNPADVIDAVDDILNRIERERIGENYKSDLREQIRKLSSKTYKDKNEFIKDLELVKDDLLNTKSENVNLYAGSQLNKILWNLTVQNTSVEHKNINAGSSKNPESNTMESLDMSFIKERYPNSGLVKFYDDNGIEEYLNKNSNKITGDTDIFFIVDNRQDGLTSTTRNEMGKKYSPNDLPIIIAVQDDNGTITIGDKNYQPIGIMPSTGNESFGGSNHMKTIRQYAEKMPSGQASLVTYQKDGKTEVLTTKPNGKSGGIHGKPKDSNNRQNESAKSVIINSLKPSDAEEVKDNGKNASAVWKKAKDHFISKLRTKLNGQNKQAYYEQDTLQNNKGHNDIFIFKKPISESVEVDEQHRTLKEVIFNGKTTDETVFFNSRTNRLYHALYKIFENLPSVNDGKQEILELGSTIDNNGNKKIGKIEETIRRYIYITGERGHNFRITVTPTDNIVTDDNTGQSERQFSIDLEDVDGTIKIHLSEFYSGNTFRDIGIITQDIIRNLVFDEKREVRKNGEPDDPNDAHKNDLAVWQLDLGNIDAVGGKKKDELKTDQEKAAYANLSDMLDDDILEMPATSLNYQINSMQIQCPPGIKQQETQKAQTSTNNDNASTKEQTGQQINSVGQVVSSNGATAEEDSGSHTGGTPETPKNEALARAEEIVKQIQADSEKIKSPTEEVNDRYEEGEGDDKITYARVTSIISADENADERFDPNSPWVIPSTKIGTSVDEFVRDFFEYSSEEMNKRIQDGKYPNASKNQWAKFKEDLESLKRNMEAQGLHIVSRNIIATGHVTVTDKNGKTYQMNVAGTLDLLVYDSQGNFYIYDMKTVHDTGKIQSKRKKWGQQTSLYENFLKEKYGINVVGRCIIPISVNYPAPSKRTKYEEGPEENQLMHNGKAYNNAQPRLLTNPVINVDKYEPHTIFEKLTDAERQMIGAAIEEQTGETEVTPDVVEAPSEPEVIIDPITGLNMGNDWANDYFDENVPTGQNQNAGILEGIGKPAWRDLSEKLKENLKKHGITEENYDSLPQDQFEHMKECNE